MKADLLKRLGEQGLQGTFKWHPIWEEAFEAYKKDTGDYQIGGKCSSCYKKVLAWLKK